MDVSLAGRGPVQSAPGIPEGAWLSGQFSSVHTVVLCAQLEDGLALSAALAPRDYDTLLNEFQQAVVGLVAELHEQDYNIAEARLDGERLTLCFYDVDEVARNYALDGGAELLADARRHLVDACRRSNRELTFQALKVAIRLKHLWLVQPTNVARLRSHREQLDLRSALHYGWAQLGERADGTIKAEGHALNVCRALLTEPTPLRYSRIVATRAFHDTVRSTVIKHTQLRQRVFFAQASTSQTADAYYELKFCHRIGREVELTDEAVNQYEAALNLNHSNIWAYYQLAEHYGVSRRDWHRAFALAKAAQLAHHDDEKVLLDIAKYYLQQGKLEQSREFAQRALHANPHFDLAYEHLGMIAAHESDFAGNEQHWRSAVRLTPGSPVNNFNLGLAMICQGRADEGFHYIQEAVRVYPDYASQESFIGPLQLARAQGQLPEILESYLDELSAGGDMAGAEA